MSCYDHEDCAIGTYCNVLNYWPYQSVCTVYRNEDEVCTEDYQCAVHQFCWYKHKADLQTNTTRCLPTYQQDDGT